MDDPQNNNSNDPGSGQSHPDDSRAHSESEMSRINLAFQDLVDVLSKNQKFEELIPAVLRISGKAFRVNRCAYFEHDRDEIFLRYWYSDGEVLKPDQLNIYLGQHSKLIRMLAAGFKVPDEYLGTPADQRNRAVVIDHGVGTIKPDFDEFAIDLGGRLELNIPVVIGQTARAALVIYRSEGRFTDQEVQFGEALAKQFALALQLIKALSRERESTKLESAQKEWESRTRELDLVNGSLSEALLKATSSEISEVPGLLLIEISKVTNADICYWFEFDKKSRLLTTSVRIKQNEIINREADEPSYFCRPFSADIAPVYDPILNTDEFITAMVEDAPMVWPETKAWHEKNGRKHALAFGIKIGNSALGIIGLGWKGRPTVDGGQQSLFRALAHQFALAVEMKRLSEGAKTAAVAKEKLKAAEEKADELAKANSALQISLGKLATDSNLDLFLGHVLKSIAGNLGEDSGSVWLNSEAQERIHLLMNLEAGEIEYAQKTSHPGISIEDHPNGRDRVRPKMLANQIVLHDAAELYNSPEWALYRDYYRERGVLSVLSVPMFVGEKFLGIYTVRSKKREHFDSAELELAKALANQAALAIHVNRLAEAAKLEASQAAVLDERNRIARDLHDSLAHGFTGVILQLEAATELRPKKPDAAEACVERAKLMASFGLKKARESVAALQVDPLIYQNFLAALKNLIEDTATGSKIKMRVECDEEPRRLAADVGLQLYHVAQEALGNVIRHSNAGNVVFKLQFSDRRIRLVVSDDGVGLNESDAEKAGGNGLKNMRFRCERILGQFSIDSRIGKGTSIICDVPTGIVDAAELKRDVQDEE